ncbi:uncharacterized protein LOC110440319 [Mizuhopecten yessoensis]|uniref:Death domain-containing protein n=1 Tax=Mizuhopecten yessoensis TaxID=6573 RepID=A0A210PLC3_MIZYE|nr:uncharacterized protein LOC110440319 [Mizuhopecten yessoensis]OWF37298.1 hypothetical protein KP79_PYT12678 [Mizuhopecten yessoensis]
MAELSSSKDPKKTLKELYRILKEHIRGVADDNGDLSNDRDHLQDIIQQTVETLQSGRFKQPVLRRSYPDSKDKSKEIFEKEKRTQRTIESMEDHELQAFREKIKVEQSLCKTKDKLQTLEKKLESDKAEDSDISELLLEMKSLIGECLHKQTHADIMVEKISVGVQKLLDQNKTGRPKAVHEELMAFHIPAELNYACGKIQKKGVKFRQFGSALGIPDDLLEVIEDQDDEDERFRQVIWEWARVSKSVNIRDFVGACHSLGENLVKDEPLSQEETEKLLSNVDYLCENMMDVPLVLPHLVSTLVLSPGLCEYIVAPPVRIQRILRLVDILCIRKNGLEEFCVALKKSEQDHVAMQLKGLVQSVPRFCRRSRSLTSIIDDTDEDNTSTTADDSRSSCEVLQKIVRLLSTEGLIKQ